MRQNFEQDIMSATKPSDIFIMNLDTIESQKNEYVERFKPVAYNAINNFLVTQKIILLYRQALDELRFNENREPSEFATCIKSISGEQFQFQYAKSSSFKWGQLYVTHQNVIFIVESKYKAYYKNYISKTQMYSKPDKDIWKIVGYMVPKVMNHFEDTEGKFVIILKKPCEMYSLRDLLDYSNGKLEPEYVASMISRLYYFACYMDLVGMTHNGITVDNLFFSPGKFVEEGQQYTVNDMRIVGIFGGWFFTTYSDEKIKGLPAEINEVIPEEVKRNGFSSYRVDECAIKRVARELLGDPKGLNLENVPKPLCNWVNDNRIAENAYKEFCDWKEVIRASFGEDRFVSMEVSINLF